MQSSTPHKKFLKFSILMVFLTVAAGLVHLSGAWGSDVWIGETLSSKIDALGWWAPAVYVASYAVLVSLTVPGTFLTLAGAAIFPLWEAFALVIVGAAMGSSLSFFLARILGRDAIESLLEVDHPIMGKVRKVIGRFEDRGVIAVAYLRMVYVPFVALNYMAPLTGIRYRDFLVGTVIGILPGSFVFVFMGNSFQAALHSGDFSSLSTPKLAISVVLFGISLILPQILQSFVFKAENTRPTK